MVGWNQQQLSMGDETYKKLIDAIQLKLNDKLRKGYGERTVPMTSARYPEVEQLRPEETRVCGDLRTWLRDTIKCNVGSVRYTETGIEIYILS